MTKKAFKVPKLSQTEWLIVGGVSAAALYLILMNRNIGFGPVDAALEPIGDITGLEGRGAGILPNIPFGSPEVPPPPPDADDDDIKAMQAEYLDDRMTIA